MPARTPDKKVHEFKESYATGAIGEKFVWEYLKANPLVYRLWDLRDNPKFREDDVDFGIQLTNYDTYTIEVKTDTYKSTNVYYEDISADEVGSAGAMTRSKADYLYYYFMNLNRLYIFDMPQFRAFFERNKERLERKGCKKRVWNHALKHTTFCHSVGYTIPLKWIDEENTGWMKRIDF